MRHRGRVGRYIERHILRTLARLHKDRRRGRPRPHPRRVRYVRKTSEANISRCCGSWSHALSNMCFCLSSLSFNDPT
jgi:hypothetical protein